jgi:hypothetical protein
MSAARFPLPLRDSPCPPSSRLCGSSASDHHLMTPKLSPSRWAHSPIAALSHNGVLQSATSVVSAAFPAPHTGLCFRGSPCMTPRQLECARTSARSARACVCGSTVFRVQFSYRGRTGSGSTPSPSPPTETCTPLPTSPAASLATTRAETCAAGPTSSSACRWPRSESGCSSTARRIRACRRGISGRRRGTAAAGRRVVEEPVSGAPSQVWSVRSASAPPDQATVRPERSSSSNRAVSSCGEVRARRPPGWRTCTGARRCCGRPFVLAKTRLA